MTVSAYDMPADFWGNFSDDFILEQVNPADALERWRIYADRATYENWREGNFTVIYKDGRTEHAQGVTFNARALAAAIDKATGKDTEA